MAARSGMTSLLTRLRTMVADAWRLKQDSATGDGATKVYWLTHSPQASGGTVSVGGTVQTITTDYTWDTAQGRLGLVAAPANGVAIAVEYRTAQLTDDELQDALDQHVSLLDYVPLTWLHDENTGGTTVYHRAKAPMRDLEEAASGTIRWDVRDGTGAQNGTANYTPDYLAGIIRWTADQGGTAYYLTARSYDLHAAAADVWLQKAASLAEAYQFEGDGQKFMRQQAYKQAAEMADFYRRRTGQNKRRGALQTGTFQRVDLVGGFGE